MKNIFTLLLLIFFGSLSIAQSIDFGPKQKLFDHHTSGLLALAYIPMDYNQDGITDYIGRGENNDLVVHIGTDNGFEISDDISVESFPYARPYDIVDFNQDGFEDIIMEWFIYIYDPLTNEYNELAYTDPGDLQTIMGVADFDGNGYTDLLTVLSSGSKQNDLAIYYYDGADFERIELFSEEMSEEIGIGPLRVGDLESDGDMDIAMIDKYNTSTPVILVNDGFGNFTTRYIQDPELLYSRVLDFEDLDSDGDLDLLVYNINHEFIIYENTDNYINPPSRYLIQNATKPISNVISDLNGDGNKEIISFNIAHEAFSVDLYIGGNGLNYSSKIELANFQIPTFFLGLNPNYDQNTLRLRNVDGDGDMDLILSFSAGDAPSVYLFENLTNNSFDASTSSKEVSSSQNLSLYPNPVINELFINGDFINQTYSILDLNGRTIKQSIFSGSIDVTDVPKGPYIIQIDSDHGSKSSLFVKTDK